MAPCGGAGEPSEEICDGRDNDCDGVVDDDPIDLGECTAGVGECAVDGSAVCTEDGIECDAVATDPPESPETSCADGCDNDCDGRIDAQDPDCDEGLCCDPALEPGVGGNPFCFAGHTCCADGTWRRDDPNGNTCDGPVGEVCQPVFCTDDVKLCPDGSILVRNPNNDWEFFPCP